MKIADKVDVPHEKEPKIEQSPSLRGHSRYKSSMFPCVPSQKQSLVLCLMRETRKYILRACWKVPNQSKVRSLFLPSIIFSCQVLRFRAIIIKFTYDKKYPYPCFEYFEQHSFHDTGHNGPQIAVKSDPNPKSLFEKYIFAN